MAGHPDENTETSKNASIRSLNAPASQHDVPPLLHHIQNVASKTLIGTGFGVMFGASIAAMRRQNVGFVAVSMGLNYTIFAGSFFTVREAAMSFQEVSPQMAAAVAGSVSGGMLTLAFTGKMTRGIQGALVWGGAAYLAQMALDAAASRTQQYKESLRQNKATRAQMHGEAASTEQPTATPSLPTAQATPPSPTRRTSPSSSLSSLVAHIDTFDDLPPDMRPAARAEFVRRNKENFEQYGVPVPQLHSTPPLLSGYQHLDGGAAPDGQLPQLPPRPQYRASELAPDPFSDKSADHEASWWDWLPVKSYTNAEMEVKLKKRLRKIERTLMRDDEYRRIQMGAMNEASQPDELSVLRKAPHLLYPELARIPKMTRPEGR